jgi:transposase-like protein
MGKDGRVRPVNTAAGRLRAAEIVRDKPGASLREIAHAAGVSPMTVRDVRDRLERGDALTPDKHTPTRTTIVAPRRTARINTEPTTDPMMILNRLRRDPSLFQTEDGRMLLRRLDAQMRGLASYPTNSAQVPPHCLYTLAELARAFADRWQALAKELEHHLKEL